MSKVSETQFHSSTAVATRWALTVGGASLGYVIELKAHDPIPYNYLVIVLEGREVHVLEFDELDPETEYNSYDALKAGRNIYMTIPLNAGGDAATDWRRTEGLTAMVMHGKLGPYEDDVWRERWVTYATKTA